MLEIVKSLWEVFESAVHPRGVANGFGFHELVGSRDLFISYVVILESIRGNCGTFQGVIRCLHKYFSAKGDVGLSI